MEYHFCNRDEPITLDPAHIFGLVEQRVALCLFEGLTVYNPHVSQPIPGMAESWEISNDGLVYRFHLRQNSFWSDGRLVTAHDFVYAWQRILEEKSDLPYRFLLFHLQGSEDYFKGRMDDQRSLGFKALDDFCLEVCLTRPLPYFLWLTSFITLLPVPAWCISKNSQFWWQVGEFVGNGPFCLESWHKGEKIVLKRNEGYWDNESIRLDSILIDLDTDEQKAINHFIEGKTSHVYDVSASVVADLSSQSELDMSPRLAVTYLLFNPQKAPFNIRMVRKALSISIERNDLQAIKNQGDFPAYSFIPPLLKDYEGFKGLKPSISAAIQLLEQSGFTQDQDSTFEIIYTYPEQKRLLEELIDKWFKHLNLKAKLIKKSWEDYMESLTSLNYEITISKWVADYPDPSTFLDWFKSDCASAELGYSNPKVDENLRQAHMADTASQREECYSAVEQIVVEEDALILPLFFHANRQLRKRNLKGLHPNPFGLQLPKYIWLNNCDP